MTPEQFVANNSQFAKNAEAKYGVPFLVALAQAALESAWGRKAPGNNLFGVKADKSWKGPTVDIPTQEVMRGKRVRITDKFRAYPTTEGSFMDYGAFLTTNKRYASAFTFKDDPIKFARAIATAGYSTDNTTTDGNPTYADTLCSVIASVRKRLP